MWYTHPLWIIHFLFWWPFILRGQVERMKGTGAHLGEVKHRHPRAVELVAVHSVGVFLMYFGIGDGAAKGMGREFGAPMVVGGLLIFAGSALARWTIQTFRSWRLRAELTEHHVLETGGPYRYLRHPIYMAMNLLALGTAVWIPNVWTALGLVVTVVGSDLRARAEEGLLVTAFGDEYRAYMARVRRFVPGVY